ncbi:MAG: hypothetical protein C4541_03160 [Candidatus Auribacter fodinae]|uniref:Uncharacterized protein n=1 Tax=Candidatus Auribacter fodinae TaxID=2093366 RepID=A0A3A4R478_9BACT|nr:MAG: hypothetical protein C4541_03160 [Candidatus Auribacter fodinae]
MENSENVKKEKTTLNCILEMSDNIKKQLEVFKAQPPLCQISMPKFLDTNRLAEDFTITPSALVKSWLNKVDTSRYLNSVERITIENAKRIRQIQNLFSFDLTRNFITAPSPIIHGEIESHPKEHQDRSVIYQQDEHKLAYLNTDDHRMIIPGEYGNENFYNTEFSFIFYTNLKTKSHLENDNLRLDILELTAEYKNIKCSLTPQLFEVLHALALAAIAKNKFLSHDRLYNLWAAKVSSEQIRWTIYQIKESFKKAGLSEQDANSLFTNFKGEGYRLNKYPAKIIIS